MLGRGLSCWLAPTPSPWNCAESEFTSRRISLAFSKGMEAFSLPPFNLSRFSPENQIERIIFTPRRTQIRNRFLRCTVSNQQNKVGKENRQNRPVPSEKGLALKGRDVGLPDRVGPLASWHASGCFQASLRRRFRTAACGALKCPI